MNHGAGSDSTDCEQWCRHCADTLRGLEPRLAPTDCDDLAGTLWQLDVYRRMAPVAAAQKFLAENLEKLVASLSS